MSTQTSPKQTIPRNKGSGRFWNFEDGNILRINGYIAESSWLADDVTPKVFKNELMACSGDITVWINSPGGDVFAASQIYAMLKEHKGKVTVKIDGVAASAASVIAMAGASVEMTPTAVMMIHNPMTLVFGEVGDLEQGIEMLAEVKESIINAYEIKTGMSRHKLASMMDSETWMSANKALELGFCDKVLYSVSSEELGVSSGGFDYIFNRASMALATVNAMRGVLKKKEAIEAPQEKIEESVNHGTDYAVLERRLSLLKN